MTPGEGGGGCPDPAGTVGYFLCRAGSLLRAAAVESPRLEARLLLGHAMGEAPGALIGMARRAVPAEAAASFGALLRGRLAGAPVAHLVGEREFWSLRFAVSADTLIPRADSEALIEAAVAWRDVTGPACGEVCSVLDLGTGTGCLLLAALTEFPGAVGVGVDRVPAAAALARRNAAALGLAGRAAFLVGEWGAALGGRFDLVLCNPPYVETDALARLQVEVTREPASALDGGADGLDAYRAVLAGLPERLAPGGLAVLELGAGQRAAVEGLAATAGLRAVAARQDLGGVDRALGLISSQDWFLDRMDGMDARPLGRETGVATPDYVRALIRARHGG